MHEPIEEEEIYAYSQCLSVIRELWHHFILAMFPPLSDGVLDEDIQAEELNDKTTWDNAKLDSIPTIEDLNKELAEVRDEYLKSIIEIDWYTRHAEQLK